jgi:tetratricopeptide (TPR) repeat protein
MHSATPKLFISYRRSQASAVRPAVTALERAGIDCFFDQDDIDPLADFPQRIREGIDASHALLAWWSADYGDSEHCLAELRLAWQRARRRSSDVGRRIWVLNPEPQGHHIFAGELNSKNFLVAPAPADLDAWAQRMKTRLDALLPEGPLADERESLAPGTLRNVPAPCAHFTGRGATLLRLHSKLFPPRIGAAAAGASVWLHGLAGVGKTEIAARYAHDYAHAYPGGVFWLDFAAYAPQNGGDDASAQRAWLEAVEAAFAAEPALRAALLHDEQDRSLPPQRARESVASWLPSVAADGESSPYLWILDGVPPLSPQDRCDRILAFWRAPTASGRTLVTSLAARVPAGFTGEELGALGEDDALRLLARFRPIDAAELTAARALAAEVGRHSIALTLLGERVGRDGDYARALETLRSSGRIERLEALAERLRPALGAAARSVTATFALCIDPLADDARRLLALASLCAPNAPVPRAVLRDAFGGDLAADEFADATAALLAASLLADRRGRDALEIQPLVADSAARLLGATAEQQGEALAQSLLSRLAAAEDIRAHEALVDTIAHARQLAVRLRSASGVRLANRVGRYERVRGQFEAAKQAEALAVERAHAIFGNEHPETLVCRSNQAETLAASGELTLARRLQEDVVAAARRTLGAEHPATLTAIGNLAVTLQAQGDLAGASRLQRRLVDDSVRSLGEAHPDTLRAMNNLSVTLREQGDLAAALALQRQVVEGIRRSLGADHPSSLLALSNLASSLVALGHPREALPLQQQAFELSRRVMGAEHPQTLVFASNLAVTLSELGDTAAARQWHQQVLAVRQRVLGEAHPSTWLAMAGLAAALRDAGELGPARALQEQALARTLQRFGAEHPDTLTAKNNLADILKAHGELEAARRLQQEVAALRGRVLGETHPDSLAAQSNLAATLYEQGELDAARALQQRALEASRDTLGANHPDTARCMNNLAETLRAAGQLDAALPLYEQAVACFGRTLGEESPRTLVAKNNLALARKANGDLAGARALLESTLAASRRVRGEEHPDTLRAMSNLAAVCNAQGEHAEALRLRERVLDVRLRQLGEAHPDTLQALGNLAATRHDSGDLAGAQALRERLFEIRRRTSGAEAPETLAAMGDLAATLWALGDLVTARRLLERLLDARRHRLGEEDPLTTQVRMALTVLAAQQGDDGGVRAVLDQAPPQVAAQIRAWLAAHSGPDTGAG